MDRIFDGAPVRLVNAMYKTETEGTVIVPSSVLDSPSAPLGVYGTWTILLENGERFRSEGILDLVIA